MELDGEYFKHRYEVSVWVGGESCVAERCRKRMEDSCSESRVKEERN